MHKINKIVVQPTTLCNLNCDYCYLSGRNIKNNMPVEVMQRLVANLDAMKETSETITIIWHGGEPLACGIQHFRELINPFSNLRATGRIEHNLQTNGTLITDAWCDLFKEHDVSIGISLDGPATFNIHRIGWDNNPAYERILKGIELLKKREIPFGVIAVVTQDSLGKAEELYEFFSTLGCHTLGINIVEEEGVNLAFKVEDQKGVQTFWEDLFKAWQKNPCIRIREFDHMLSWIQGVIDGEVEENPPIYVDPFPTMTWNGDISLIAPEIAGVSSAMYNTFTVGNILQESLEKIVRRGMLSIYVQDFIAGVSQCQAECPYYGVCRGGQASNKLFEHGTMNATQTKYCQNTEMALFEALIESV